MTTFKITDNGRIIETITDTPLKDSIRTTKMYRVSKAGADLYFGNLRMVVKCVEDIGTSETTLYAKKIGEKGVYITKTGYTISVESLKHLPTESKRK